MRQDQDEPLQSITGGSTASSGAVEESSAVDRFQVVFDQAAIGIKLVDGDGRLLDVNEAVCGILGYERQELIGRNFVDLIDPEDRPQAQALASRLLAGEMPRCQIEKRYRRKDGTLVWVRVTSSLAGAGTSQPYRISVVEDISERKQAEEALQAGEARLRTILDAIPIGAVVGDESGRIVEANKAYLDLIGRTRDDLLSGHVRWDEITPPEWLAADERAVAEARTRGVSTLYEKEYLRNGERIPVLVGLAKLGGGETMAAFTLDIRERKAAEAALRARTLEWEALVETAPVATWFTYDPDLQEVKANRFAAKLLDVPLISKFAPSGFSATAYPPRRIYRNDVEPPVTEYPLARAIRGEEVRNEEWEVRFDDGRSIALLYNATALRDTTGAVIGAMSTAVDITERKRSEAALREREARLQSILDTVPEALITINNRGLIESFSRSAETLFGYRAEEAIGRNVSMLMPSPHREEHDGYIARYVRTGERRIIGTGRVVQAQRKDGSQFPVELAVGEVKVGERLLFTGFIRDLTANQKIEQELRQAQKMEAVGQLTGGIAHDFNNLLTVILGNLEMLEMRLTDGHPTDPVQAELAREARETAEHGARLTESLLAFGRRQPLQPRLTDVGMLVGEMTPLLRRTLGETVRVTGRSDNDLWPVLVDPSQLQNALLNLAINARDAMPCGGRLTITPENTELDADYARMHPEVRAGRYVLIAITDTGTGMPRDRAGAGFRALFHHQGGRRGQRARPVDGLRLRQAVGRACGDLQRARPWHDDPHVSATGRCDGRGFGGP